MREPIKTKFSWDDREDEDTFSPCNYCKALETAPTCDDGATCSACNHCDYNIILHCLNQNTD